MDCHKNIDFNIQRVQNIKMKTCTFMYYVKSGVICIEIMIFQTLYWPIEGFSHLSLNIFNRLLIISLKLFVKYVDGHLEQFQSCDYTMVLVREQRYLYFRIPQVLCMNSHRHDLLPSTSKIKVRYFCIKL